MASWEIRIDSSSGKSRTRRWAICSGLHDLAHGRSLRRPWRRPIHRMSGPGTGPPSARVITPARRSLTYSRSCSFAASLDTLGRRARLSAYHWAVDARYSRRYVRVEALRPSSREIVEGSRPRRRAISRTPICWACKTAMSSRSTNDRYRPETGAKLIDGIPPAWRNHRVPIAGDTPAATPASSLERPRAIASQNFWRCSRRPTGSRPGGCFWPRMARTGLAPLPWTPPMCPLVCSTQIIRSPPSLW